MPIDIWNRSLDVELCEWTRPKWGAKTRPGNQLRFDPMVYHLGSNGSWGLLIFEGLWGTEVPEWRTYESTKVTPKATVARATLPIEQSTYWMSSGLLPCLKVKGCREFKLSLISMSTRFAMFMWPLPSADCDDGFKRTCYFFRATNHNHNTMQNNVRWMNGTFKLISSRIFAHLLYAI